MGKYRTGRYTLPANLYMRMLYLIRDYDRIQKLADGIRNQKEKRGTLAEWDEERLREAVRECEAVEQALVRIPFEYHAGILNNIKFKCQYPCDADKVTYQRWKQRLIYHTAKNLKLW